MYRIIFNMKRLEAAHIAIHRERIKYIRVYPFDNHSIQTEFFMC
jgi:hypothetical protein